jgi:hypothetical protein
MESQGLARLLIQNTPDPLGDGISDVERPYRYPNSIEKVASAALAARRLVPAPRKLTRSRLSTSDPTAST